MPAQILVAFSKIIGVGANWQWLVPWCNFSVVETECGDQITI
jgi:hypothetical protein